MPYDVPTPEVREFILDRMDAVHGIPPESATKVTIRQATVRQNRERSVHFKQYKRQLGDGVGGPEYVVVDLPLYDLTEAEVFLTLVGCNITKNGKSMFRFKQTGEVPILDMDLPAFRKVWGQLTDEIATEIHEKVLIVNSHWVWKADAKEDNDLGEES